MPFPKLIMVQISDKQVVIAVSEEPKLSHFKQHLDAAGYMSSIEAAQLDLSFRNNLNSAPSVLLVHGDLHDVSEVIRECWP